jgi:hypothetical protein
MNLSKTIVSTILWNDALPTGSATDTPVIDAYIAANPTNDYVIEAAAQWNNLFLAKTDVLTTEKEYTTEVSLSDIMKILKDKLRIFWHIDTDGYFRLEHQKYYRDFISQCDLTSVTYAPNKPEVDVSIYDYEFNQLFNQITVKENNEKTIGFVSYPVVFDPKQTSDNAKDINVNVTCDIEYVADNPDNAQNSGMMLLRGITMGVKTYIDLDILTLSSIYGESHPNAHLAWDYVIKYYWTYFAEAQEGYINYGLSLTTFDHVKEFLKQGNIRFNMISDLDWRKSFTLAEGTGWIENAEYYPETGIYKIDVGFNPYATEITIVDSEDSTIIITDDAGDDIIQ